MSQPYHSGMIVTEYEPGPVYGQDPEERARRRRLNDERESLPPWRDGPVALASRALDCLTLDLPLPSLYRLPDGREISTRDYLAMPNKTPAPTSLTMPWGIRSPVRQADEPEVTWGQLNAEILRRCVERGIL